MVVGDDDIGDALNSELVEPIEDRAASDVHQHGIAAAAEEVDVARVANETDTGDRLECCRDAHGCPSLCRSPAMWQRLHFRGRSRRFPTAWGRSTSRTWSRST